MTGGRPRPKIRREAAGTKLPWNLETFKNFKSQNRQKGGFKMAYYGFDRLLMWAETQLDLSLLLIFLLIFTIIYAVMQKTRVLGDKKGPNVVVALVVALLVVLSDYYGWYGGYTSPIAIIRQALPSVSIVVLAVIMLLILVGVWGAEADWVAGNKITGAIVIVSALVVLYIFGAAAQWWHGWDWLYRIFGSDALSVVIMILVFALIIFFITRDSRETKGEGLMKSFGEMFKKR